MNDMIFASRLKELRKQNGLMQKEFAEKIGISTGALSSYENGAKSPSVATAKHIAYTFNVSLDWLCGIENRIIFDGYPFQNLLWNIVQIVESVYAALDYRCEFATNDIDRNHFVAEIKFNSLFGDETIDYHAKIIEFISRWQPVQKLFHDDVISYDIYKAWLNQEISLYGDCSVSNPFISEINKTETDFSRSQNDSFPGLDKSN